jgi:hypothetical protein
LSKIHCKAARAEIAPELLAEQNLDISLFVNHENKQAHARPPLATDREATYPITCIVGRSRANNSKDAAASPRALLDPLLRAAPSKYQISNRERCAEHHSRAARRDAKLQGHA